MVLKQFGRLNGKESVPDVKRRILFVNHPATRCGVHEFGSNLGRALQKPPLGFTYCECSSAQELELAIRNEAPHLIIYNYHPSTMGWLTGKVTRRIKCPQIGMIHEVTQQVADRADNRLFNFHLAHDPTLLLKNPIVFKAGRLIPRYEKSFESPSTPTIGSFGFAAGKKGLKRIVELVEREFDKAVVRLNIPFATFGDSDGAHAKSIVEECRMALTKPGIELDISHEFLEQQQLLDFLASNTVNLFLYEAMELPRGISSAIDLALAAKRPIGVTRNSMFRHILGATPSICVEDSSIKQIVENGIRPLEPFYGDWSEEIIRWDYDRIVTDVLQRARIPPIRAVNDAKISVRGAKRFIRRTLGRPAREPMSWITDTSVRETSRAPVESAVYIPAVIPDNWPLNNILDDKARRLYEGTIEQMFGYLPDLMKRKIAEANVQQAFVLDSVYKTISGVEQPRTLCVGSFEDSAMESLKVLGFSIEEVDPMVNYDLGTFMTKPTTKAESFDVVFSTSVIEHVEDDETFMIQIASLLKKGGIAILTCDYCDAYKAGDPKPMVDYRLYTQKDFTQRLLPRLPECELVDTPQWNCPNPDFWHAGVNYTFATLVLRKVR